MPSTPTHALRPLKEAGRQTVWLIQRPGEQQRTLKTWVLTPWLAFKLLLGIAQPQRQTAGARLTQRAGVRTAPVMGSWRPAWRGRPVIELELGFVPGRSAQEVARDPGLSDREQRRGSAAIGRLAALLLAAGLLNRDFKLNNVIIDDAGEPWMIDTVGVRRSYRPEAAAARMLERLSLQLPRPVRTAAWVPGMRHALRGLPARSRREVVRRLRQHRTPESC